MVKYLLRPWILALTLIGFALLLVPATALAQASPPHLFLGEAGAVTEGPNNEPVKSGTITAWIDDKEIASGTVTDGAYNLFVEQPPGSNFTGKFVEFTVDGSPTDARAMWRTGGADVVPQKVIPAQPAATEVPSAQTAATEVPSAQTAATEVPSAQTGGKFRENPTTRLRPVEDVITSDQDGIIEAFMVNPTVNDVSLSVDLVLTVPAGIHVYGEGFACSGTGAGTCAGYFTILPGQSKTVVINVKSEKVGSHNVHLSGYWWPGDNKDMRQPISLTHPFKVTSPSKDLSDPALKQAPAASESPATMPPPAQPVDNKGGDGSCGLSSGGSVPLGAITLFLGVGLMAFRNKLGDLF